MRRLRANVQVWAEGGPRQRGDGETGLWGNEVGWVGFVRRLHLVQPIFARPSLKAVQCSDLMPPLDILCSEQCLRMDDTVSS